MIYIVHKFKFWSYKEVEVIRLEGSNELFKHLKKNCHLTNCQIEVYFNEIKISELSYNSEKFGRLSKTERKFWREY